MSAETKTVMPNPHPTRILIVDHNPKAARALLAALEAAESGVVASIAFDSHTAIAKVQGIHYAGVIVAQDMPNLTGIDLAQAVGQISPDTRVVLVSGAENWALRETARLMGINDFLINPVQPSQLRQLFCRKNGNNSHTGRVLLFEREHALRHRYGDALRDAQFQVHEAGALEEAHDLFAVRHFDVFICALDADGGSVAHFVRQQRPVLRRAGTKVIGITSRGGYDCSWDELGVDLHLQTPVAADSLVRLVARIGAA